MPYATRNELNLFSQFFSSYMEFYLYGVTPTGIVTSKKYLRRGPIHVDESEKAIAKATEILGPDYSISFELRYESDRGTEYRIYINPCNLEQAVEAWLNYTRVNFLSTSSNSATL